MDSNYQTMVEQLKAEADRGPISAGMTQLKRHLNGERLTQREAIHAKCCDCSGYFVDGRYDCENPACPLHPWMAYKSRTRPRS
jgi:hypothetical protein